MYPRPWQRLKNIDKAVVVYRMRFLSSKALEVNVAKFLISSYCLKTAVQLV